MVTLLLQHGADSDIPDDGGLTPLDTATQRGHTDVVAVLGPSSWRRHFALNLRLGAHRNGKPCRRHLVAQEILLRPKVPR